MGRERLNDKCFLYASKPKLLYRSFVNHGFSVFTPSSHLSLFSPLSFARNTARLSVALYFYLSIYVWFFSPLAFVSPLPHFVCMADQTDVIDLILLSCLVPQRKRRAIRLLRDELKQATLPTCIGVGPNI